MPKNNTPEGSLAQQIARYEELRAKLNEIDRQAFEGLSHGYSEIDDEAATLSRFGSGSAERLFERMDEIDTELIEIEWRLPKNYLYVGRPVE